MGDKQVSGDPLPASLQMITRCHQGLVRSNNEDCVTADVERQLAIVADGMGGLEAGEQASQSALDAALDCLKGDTTPPDQRVLAAIDAAHQAVLVQAEAIDLLGQMGTTLLCAVWEEGLVHFAHVGDSRLYAFSPIAGLTQLSTDHTLAQRMVDAGLVKPHEAHRAPNQNVLTQAIGLPGMLLPQQGEHHGADRYLLCSDGLSDMVPRVELERILHTRSLDQCADQLVEVALEHGGRDNISLVLVEVTH